MIPYFLLVSIPIAVAILDTGKNKSRNRGLIVFFTILFFMLALRGISCGTDLVNYKLKYINSSYISVKEMIVRYGLQAEVFYYALNRICYVVTDNFQFFLMIVAAICVVPIAIFYCKTSRNQILTITLFLTIAPFSMFFSGLRQSIAMAIVVMSYKFIKEKKVIPFILMTLLAYEFHQSSIFMLILYPLYHAKITRKWLVVVVPTMISVFIFRNKIFSSMMNLVSGYADKYNVITMTGAYSILILLILFCIYCFVCIDKEKESEEFIGFRNFLLCATCIQCFSSINPLIMRVNYYIILFIPVLIPMVSENCYDKNKKIISIVEIVMCVFFASYFFVNAYTSEDILNIYPYIPFWEV